MVTEQGLDQEERDLIMKLSPAYFKWEQETIHQGIKIAAIRLVKAGIPLQQVAQILELDPVNIQQMIDASSSSEQSLDRTL